MTNTPIDPKQQNNELSEQELESVAGGGKLGEAGDAVKEFVSDVYKETKDKVSDLKKI